MTKSLLWCMVLITCTNTLQTMLTRTAGINLKPPAAQFILPSLTRSYEDGRTVQGMEDNEHHPSAKKRTYKLEIRDTATTIIASMLVSYQQNRLELRLSIDRYLGAQEEKQLLFKVLELVADRDDIHDFITIEDTTVTPHQSVSFRVAEANSTYEKLSDNNDVRLPQNKADF